jgi:hypothetical protein
VIYVLFFSTGNFRHWTKEECVKWVEEKCFMDKEDLEMFAQMKFRGEDFDSITRSDLKEGGLALAPAKRLFNAVQELIRSKDERICNISLSHA